MTAMREILQQISRIPGIAGTLAYNNNAEILASEFPAIYEPATLQSIASLLAEDVIILQDMVKESGSLDLKFAGGRLIVKPCCGASILVLCTSTVNSQLLNLALTQAQRRIEKTAVAAPAPQRRPPASASAHLQEPLVKLKRALLERIGPIGEMVFAEIKSDWEASAPPSQRGLAELVNLLAQEIDDAADKQAFVTEAKKIIV